MRASHLHWIVGGALFASAACTDAPSNPDSAPEGDETRALANYGEARIGYKVGGSAEAAAASGGDDAPANAGAQPAPYPEPGPPGQAPPQDTDDEVEPPMCDVEPDAGTDGGAVDPRCEEEEQADGGVAMPKQNGNQGNDVDAEPRAKENPFFATAEESASTFALDVDGASYSLTRAGLNAGHRPAAADVRLEEFLNYFHLHYKQPEGDKPLSFYAEVGNCPWAPEHELLMLGVQGQEVRVQDAPAANLVFLLDVSGSMSAANKLPLVKRGMKMLTKLLRPQDRVSIVTYAGADRVILQGVPGDDRETIHAALDDLRSGGSTNGAGGIQRAYEIAQQQFIEGGNNRVLLATDGDFNVGLSEPELLGDFIAGKRDQGVFLSVFGFGNAWDGGNYKDETGETLSNRGDGIYFYVDSEEEARRAFLHSASGSLITVAKDVKIQVEFNASKYAAYRLLGYENRVLANDDFSNDDVDGGELGASLSMTALYELIPVSVNEVVPEPLPGTVPDALTNPSNGTDAPSDSAEFAASVVAAQDLFDVRVRYKGTGGGDSTLLSESYGDEARRASPSLKFTFASTIAEFAASLRRSQYQPDRGTGALITALQPVLAVDDEGAVQEVIDLIRTADDLR